MTETKSLAGEQWMPVPAWEHYEVSDLGRIRSQTGRILRGLTLGYGYRGIILCRAGMQQRRYLQDLVLTAFRRPRPTGWYACHNNGVRDDNRLVNLRWDTPRANNLDQVVHGTNFEARKTHCPCGHRLAEPNLVASELRRGHRKCRACNQARAAAQHRKAPFDPNDADRRYAALLAVAS